jgi:hypothetical protein
VKLSSHRIPIERLGASIKASESSYACVDTYVAPLPSLPLPPYRTRGPCQSPSFPPPLPAPPQHLPGLFPSPPLNHHFQVTILHPVTLVTPQTVPVTIGTPYSPIPALVRVANTLLAATFPMLVCMRAAILPVTLLVSASHHIIFYMGMYMYIPGSIPRNQIRLNSMLAAPLPCTIGETVHAQYTSHSLGSVSAILQALSQNR